MDCALSGECEFFHSNCSFLKIATERAGYRMTGCEEKDTVEFLGVRHEIGPRIVLLPSFGVTIRAMKEKIKGNVSVSIRSSAVISGYQTHLADMEIDGAVVISNANVKNLAVRNKGWEITSVGEQTVEPAIAIRGFIVRKLECLEKSR